MKPKESDVLESLVRKIILMVMGRLAFKDYSATDPKWIQIYVRELCSSTHDELGGDRNAWILAYVRVMNCMNWEPDQSYVEFSEHLKSKVQS
jgi:hypothetical protein